MLAKLSRLFNRYCDHHYAIYVPGFPIFDSGGRKLGQLERICFGRSSVRLEGWSASEKISIGRPGDQNWQSLDIFRADVNAAMQLPASKRTGFNLSWYGESEGVFVSFRTGHSTLQIMCPGAGRLRTLKAKVHIRASFTKALLRAAPSLIRAVLAPSVTNRLRAKHALGLTDKEVSHVLDGRVFEPSNVKYCEQKLTLVMPVFNAFEVLQLALERVVKHTENPWRLILIEDCSTDPRVRPFLRRWALKQCDLGHEVLLLENENNLGFIGSVNRAFSKALEFSDHVVLLNSDALLPKDWSARLMAPIDADAQIASVTPLSNDAEILTVPQICRANQLRDGVGDEIDKNLRALGTTANGIPIPTGVGFCMALNIKFLRKLPRFDTVFGKGYGEEVDWCQRVRVLGGIHKCQTNLFVEHRGGASFGSVAKQKAIAKNNAIVSERYPDFDKSVQRFIATDPLRTQRLFAAIAYLAATQREVPIYIAHSLGGGAELYLKEKLSDLAGKGRGAIVLRVGGRLRWQIEVHTPNGSLHGDTDDAALLHKMLTPIETRSVIYSCAVGDRNPIELTHDILELAGSETATLTFLVHDFYAISPSYCLLDSHNAFRGIPDSRSSDQRHEFHAQDGRRFSNAIWRTSWRRVLIASDEVVCFSSNSADLMRQAFPGLDAQIRIKPHKIKPLRAVQITDETSRPSIGVLGDIGIQKGAKVLCGLSDKLDESKLKNIVIVGRMDPQFQLGPQCIETGAYTRDEISNLAERHGIHAWFIPSIWPETFSYTTHEALSTGLPVFAFDIGAQGEALKHASNGHLLPLDLAQEPQQLLSKIEEVIAHGASRRRSDASAESRRNRGFAA